MSKLYATILTVLAMMFIVTAGFSSAVQQSVRPVEAATTEPTLRDILSKPTPMTSSYEVVDVVNGEYHLVDVSLYGNDQGTFILEGDYEIGDVVTVLWATEKAEEIAGDVLVGKANELDKQH